MNPNQIIETLRAHRETLEGLGVRHLALFGSQARGDATAASDVDIAIEMDPAKRLKGLSYFGQLQELEDMIGAALKRPIDLADEEMLHVPMKNNYLKDRIIAF